MIHVLISKYELSEYLFSDLEGIDTIFMPVRKHNPFCHRMIKAFYYKVCSKVYSDYFSKEISKRLKSIPTDDTLIVIGEDTYSYWVLSHLCKHVKNKVAYFWNPCVSVKNQKICRSLQKSTDRAKSIIEYIRCLGFKMASFDSSDAETYNMFYYPQFYRSYPAQDTAADGYDCDFFFCGRDKGRRSLIDYFQKRLSKFGKCKFIIIPENNPDYFTYFDYLDVIKRAKVLCEICQPGQSGLTIRALEAVFHNKKLITTNINIKYMDFYNPKNILMLTPETTDEQIVTFLNKDYLVLGKDIMQKYEVSTMLRTLNKMFGMDNGKY